jgi:allantoate deiminase
MRAFSFAAHRVIDRCRQLAQSTEEPGHITRTFLSKPMHDVHRLMTSWMEETGMKVTADRVGNLRGVYASPNPKRLIIGSHLDTVPRAGAFDGILGVVLGIELISLLPKQLNLTVEVIGFSEEEGVRFGVPFIGSRALIGDTEFLSSTDKHGVTVEQAIRDFNPDLSHRLQPVDPNAQAYLEFHIEQGPVLESLDLQLGLVEAIVGQTRLHLTFEGRANHAGTTPMHLRADALQGAAEWIGEVEAEATSTDGLVATVGKIDVAPGAGNVIPGSARASLDVRHAKDDIRHRAVARLKATAQEICYRRKLTLCVESLIDQPAVPTDRRLTSALETAMTANGYRAHRVNSGAGHDAMIVARKMPIAMLFLRSPGGVSHHPDETVRQEDVAAALATGLTFLNEMETLYAA